MLGADGSQGEGASGESEELSDYQKFLVTYSREGVRNHRPCPQGLRDVCGDGVEITGSPRAVAEMIKSFGR